MKTNKNNTKATYKNGKIIITLNAKPMTFNKKFALRNYVGEIGENVNWYNKTQSMILNGDYDVSFFNKKTGKFQLWDEKGLIGNYQLVDYDTWCKNPLAPETAWYLVDYKISHPDF